MKTIKDIQDLKNKKVLLRVDFNVSLEDGKIKDSFKIKVAKNTLDFLLERGAKVAMLSHFGRPARNAPQREAGKPENYAKEFSLEKIKDEVESILGLRIEFISDCVGEKVRKGLEEMSSREVLLLENVRFYPEEEANEEEFSKRLAENFEIYVNEAFGVSHRDQASVVGVTKFLPGFSGLNLEREVEILDKLKVDFSRPAVAVIGGAKIETKLPVIRLFEEKYDFVLVGGKVANEAIDSEEKFSSKVILPEDFIDERLDIGPKTIQKFQEIILGAKTIVWNGPMGKFEEEKYALGTEEIYEAIISNESAFKMTGGGETLEILERENSFSRFNFVSTGGGAMLEYLSRGNLPGIKSLE